MRIANLLLLLTALAFIGCKKEKIDSFEPIFKFDLNGVSKNVSFKNNFLTNGFLTFQVEGSTLYSLSLTSSDTSIVVNIRLNRPEPFWTYILTGFTNSESRASIILDANTNPKVYNSVGGTIKLTSDEIRNTKYGQLKIRTGTFDLRLIDNSSNEIQLENGYFSLPYKEY